MIRYEFDFVTNSSDAVPAALANYVYWYDTGTTENSVSVYYDSSDTYAYWNNDGAWSISLVADVGGDPANSFADSGGGILEGKGAWTGTITVNADTISDSWYRAETEVFESLVDFMGCTEDKNCYRGFLPIQGDSDGLKYFDVWSLGSGGSTEFNIERLSGESGNWCSLRVDVEINSLWETREKAMKFSGAVLAWLKSTGNFGSNGNVTWCMLQGIPSAPQEFITAGRNRKRLWRQSIPLEIVFRTEDQY